MQWAEKAACRGMGSSGFFSRRTSPEGRAAAEVCTACPVKAECLAYAMETERTDGLRIGIWGGLGPYERIALAKDTDE